MFLNIIPEFLGIRLQASPNNFINVVLMSVLENLGHFVRLIEGILRYTKTEDIPGLMLFLDFEI